MKYGNRSIWKKIIASPFTVVLLLIVFLFLVRANWNISQKTEITDARLDQTSLSLQKLENRQVELSQKVAYLSTEEGIKSEIRNKFRAAESGESVVVITDPNQNSTSTSTTTSRNVSLLSRLLKLFGIR